MNASTTTATVYDLVIIGGGPAGLTAGIYASRARLDVLLFEGTTSVSQISVTDMVENYPGLPGVTGFELIQKFKEQAAAFGLETRMEDVAAIEPVRFDEGRGWRIVTAKGAIDTRSVVISTGAEWRHINVPGEDTFAGRGVSYCATCDGPFYRDRDVVVVGGGDTAVQEALFLTKFARSVTIVHRRDRFRAAAVLQERALANEKITVAWNGVVEEITGDTAVTGVRLKDLTNNTSREIAAEGVFIFIGLIPKTGFVRGVIDLDDDGYIVTDSEMKTSQPGIFACGDCIKKSFRQVVTACGDGATAAHAVEHYLDALKGTEYGSWTEEKRR